MSTHIFERIALDPQVCHGQACIKGTRIPVHQIVGMLAGGGAIDDLLREYPSLQREDILSCLAYAAALAEKSAFKTTLHGISNIGGLDSGSFTATAG